MADVIERDPVCVLPTLTLAEFFDAVVWSQRYTTYPVFDGEHVVGMLPFRNVAAVPRVAVGGHPHLRGDDAAGEAWCCWTSRRR